MITKKNFSLKNYNSFNIDVNAKEFIEINSKEELIGLNGLLKNEKILFLGGGSNILFTKDYDGTVIYLNLKGINIEKENSDFSVVKANAGENWSDFIEFCLNNNLGGVENLSLIPGNVGSAPVQNIGAYGVELKDVFLSCEVFNFDDFSLKDFNLSDCEFEYRNSVFKKNKNYLGIYKFKLISNYTQKKVVALGGISKKNINTLRLLNNFEFAGISYFEQKKGP